MIKIASPCDADWQKMHPQAEGKFCSSCEKVVVDFSKMSDLQIKQYFNTYQDQKTCGRFLTSQVDRELQSNNKKYSNRIWNTINRFPVFRSFVLLCASSFIWLGSCVKKQTIQGKVAYPEGHSNSQLMGDTVMMGEPEDTTVLAPQEDSLQIHSVGIVDYKHEMITGKVRMTDTLSQRIKKRK